VADAFQHVFQGDVVVTSTAAEVVQTLLVADGVAANAFGRWLAPCVLDERRRRHRLVHLHGLDRGPYGWVRLADELVESVIPALTFVVRSDTGCQRSLEDVPVVNRIQRRISSQTQRYASSLSVDSPEGAADVRCVEVLDEVDELLVIGVSRQLRPPGTSCRVARRRRAGMLDHLASRRNAGRLLSPCTAWLDRSPAPCATCSGTSGRSTHVSEHVAGRSRRRSMTTTAVRFFHHYFQ